MTAAALTPTSVQKKYEWSTNSYGTPVRLIRYFIKVTKAAQNDWIVGATYCPIGSYAGGSGWTIDASGDGAAETVTYTASGTTIVMAGAAVGTAYLELIYYL